jgi:hypothetical protein
MIPGLQSEPGIIHLIIVQKTHAAPIVFHAPILHFRCK